MVPHSQNIPHLQKLSLLMMAPLCAGVLGGMVGHFIDRVLMLRRETGRFRLSVRECLILLGVPAVSIITWQVLSKLQ